MASNRRSKTVYPAIQQESAYTASGSVLPEAESMARSDSGYYSNLSNHRPGYYGDPSSVLQEEAEDYQGSDNTAMTWQYQYNMEGVEATYDQRQYSNYIVGGAGSHMTSYYQDDSTPRTTSVIDGGYEASQDMDLDDNSGTYFKVEPEWPAQIDALPHYTTHEAYQTNAQSSIMSPTSTCTEPSSTTTYFPMDIPATAVVPSSTPAPQPRRRLPNKKPSHKATTTTTPAEDTKRRITTAGSSTGVVATRFQCLVPDCSRQFNRAADLDRHQKFIHNKQAVLPMLCDYPRCGRHENPFHRADHFRDHLRDQHMEDLLKREHQGNGSASTPVAGHPKWWASRSPGAVYRGWWRCGKCFARVSVEKEGWQCGGPENAEQKGCGNFCEQERQTVRRLPVTCDYLACEMKGEGEREEWLSPQRFREHLRVVHAEDVPIREGKEAEKELNDPEWTGSRDWTACYDAKWRCTRCLDAVDSARYGWDCPRCGFVLEEARREWHGKF